MASIKIKASMDLPDEARAKHSHDYQCYWFWELTGLRGENREVRGRRLSDPGWFLELHYVGRLEALRAPDDFELDRRSFLKATVTVSLDRRKVDENIFATLPLDKTIPFAGIEPLYGSLLTIVTHVYFCSLIDSWRRQFCTSLPGLKNTNSRNLPSQPLSTTRKGYKSDKRSFIVP